MVAMLTDEQCALLEQGLTEEVEPRKLAAYLCLYLGLTSAEASALRLSDLDLDKSEVKIERVLTRRQNALPIEKQTGLSNDDLWSYATALAGAAERIIPLPYHVRRLITENLQLYKNIDTYIVSGDNEIPKSHYLQNILVSINRKYNIVLNDKQKVDSNGITPIMLRNVFIRRCLETKIDLISLGAVLGVLHVDEIVRKFGEYIKPDQSSIERLDRFSYCYKEKPLPEYRAMNLLILGAGSHGHSILETAHSMRIFGKVAFLDDDNENPEAIDVTSRMSEYVDEYPLAFVAIGDNRIRKELVVRIKKAGFVVPYLCDPSANVSASASIREGAYIGARAIIGTQTEIGEGAIVASGAILASEVKVGEFAHVDSGVTVKKGCRVEGLEKIESGK